MAALCLAAGALAQDPVPVVPAADVEHVTIRRAPPGRYAMYGGLTLLPGGEILCVFKVGSLDPETGSPWTVRDETIVWTKSSNLGHVWPDGKSIYADVNTRQENGCGPGYLSKDGRLIHPFYILNPDYEQRARLNNWSRVHLAVSGDQVKSREIHPVDVPLAIAASFGGIGRTTTGGPGATTGSSVAPPILTANRPG